MYKWHKASIKLTYNFLVWEVTFDGWGELTTIFVPWLMIVLLMIFKPLSYIMAIQKTITWHELWTYTCWHHNPYYIMH